MNLTAPPDLEQAAAPRERNAAAARELALRDRSALERLPLAAAELQPGRRVLDTPGNISTEPNEDHETPRTRRGDQPRLTRSPDDLWAHLTGSEHRSQRLAVADALGQAHDAGMKPRRGASLARREDKLRRCGECGIVVVPLGDPSRAAWHPWRCEDRLCWSCQRHRTRGVRRRIAEALLEQPEEEQLLLVTLTIGVRGECGPGEALRRMDAGRRALRREGTAHGDWWRSLVTAEIWAVEDEVGDRGHHLHAHGLVSSRGPIWYSVGAWRTGKKRRAEDETAGRPEGLTLREAWAESLGLAPRARRAWRTLESKQQRLEAGERRAARAAGGPADEAARLEAEAASRRLERDQAREFASEAQRRVDCLQVNVQAADAATASREVLKYVLKGASSSALRAHWRQVGELACELAGRRLIRTYGRWHGLEGEPEPIGEAPEMVMISGADLLAMARDRASSRRQWARDALTALGAAYREAWRRRHERADRRRRRRWMKRRRSRAPDAGDG